MIIIIPKLGIIFPNDDEPKSPKSGVYNKYYYHMLAPASFVVVTFILFYYTFVNYSKISHSYQSLISCMFALPFAVGQSIDGSH